MKTPMDDRRESPTEETYRRWDALRTRTSQGTPAAGILGRTVGFLRRTAGRMRDLGLAADLQRSLFRGLLDRQAELDEQLRTLDLEKQRIMDLEKQRTLELERSWAVEKADLTGRLAAAEAELDRLRASDADVRGAINELRAQPADEALRAQLVQLANLHDRQETLRVRQARIEGTVADLREQLASPSIIPPIISKVPFSPRDLAELLAALDDGSAGAVEVSFQDVRAESLLLAAHRHFGGRLSSSGPSYRSPNDLWIHADFTSHWDRPILLENAAARLAPGGRFLLVTAVGTGESPGHAGMALEEDRVVSLASGAVVRVISWRKPAP